MRYKILNLYLSNLNLSLNLEYNVSDYAPPVNPNSDVYFFSKYTELIYNLVLRWELTPASEFYFIYTRYWFVNGKKFDSFFNFLNYSEDDPWVEKSFDQGISIKYTRQFNL